MNSFERCGSIDNFGTACGLPDGHSGNHAGQGTTHQESGNSSRRIREYANMVRRYQEILLSENDAEEDALP